MLIEGTQFKIDQFTGRASAFLLRHYHSDHTGGLVKGWRRATLVAAPQTCRLLAEMNRVPEELLRPLSPGESTTLEDPKAGEVHVEAIEANHCPGAVMFHLQAGGASILYTGDFRLDDEMRAVAKRLAPLDLLYVDGTYAGGDYRFPPQKDAIAEVVRIAEQNTDKEILIGIYSIGKNRVIEAVSKALGKPVYMAARPLKIYTLLGYGEYVTGDRNSTNIRGYMRGYFGKYFRMQQAYRDGSACVIIPTGWAAGDDEDIMERDDKYNYVAYSEHCDGAERDEFIELCRPKRVVDI